jgi:Fur family ferric uptake transcriptional regulator
VTAPHTGPTVAAPDPTAAMAVLRERGLRLSAIRRLMLDALWSADEPLTAEGLAARLGGGAGADVASVYRNLETLEKVGLVRHFHLGHSPGLYVRAGADAREYLVCASCQTVRALDPAELEEVRDLVRDRFGWEARFSHDPIAGLCPRCAGRAEEG